MRKRHPQHAQETILVVDDTDDVRRLICEILTQQGYRVLEASNGLEALELCQANHAIHLVLTDVLMPRMTGGELAEQVRRMNPGLPLIFMSGYMEGAMIRRNAEETSFLPKPFTSVTLTRKIREVLDRPKHHG